MHTHEVQLHSHDFEWADLAHECQRIEAEQAEGHSGGESAVAMTIDDGHELCDTQQLAKEARDKWDVFHQRHSGKWYIYSECVNSVDRWGTGQSGEQLSEAANE